FTFYIFPCLFQHNGTVAVRQRLLAFRNEYITQQVLCQLTVAFFYFDDIHRRDQAGRLMAFHSRLTGYLVHEHEVGTAFFLLLHKLYLKEWAPHDSMRDFYAGILYFPDIPP